MTQGMINISKATYRYYYFKNQPAYRKKLMNKENYYDKG